MRSGGVTEIGSTSSDTASGSAAARAEARPGLRASLGAISTTLASALHTRLELASLDFAEERIRAKQQLALVLVVAISAGLALLAANVLFVLAVWERLGLYSLGILLVAYLVIAGIGGWRLAEIGRREQRPFDATLSELDRDRAWLTERFRSRA
jgi:uncharacterized membrane protein YqjE